MGVGCGEPAGAQAVRVDGDQLARLDLADDAGADDVERGGLAGDDPAALEPAEHQRPDALRVAGGVEGVLVHEDEAEGAAQLAAARSSAVASRVRSGSPASSAVTSAVSVVLVPERHAGHRLAVPLAGPGPAGSAALVRLPLWARATVPPAVAPSVGWAFSQVEPPVVE